MIFLVDLKEWQEEEQKQAVELMFSSFAKVDRGKKIKIRDVFPDDFRKHLEKGFTDWVPPGGIKAVKTYPNRNLASLLTTVPVPKVVLIPLNPHPDKYTFMYNYGLARELGLTYEHFLELVATGRIVLHRMSPPTSYKADFYQEIFDACENANYLPCQASRMLTVLSWHYKVSLVAKEMQIPMVDGFRKFVVRSNPQYDYGKTNHYVRSVFDEDALDPLRRDWPQSNGVILGRASFNIHNLRVLGFEKITEEILKLMDESKVQTWHLLNAYHHFLVSPFIEGFFGELHYDILDVMNMTFLRIIPDDLSAIWKDMLTASPASMRLTFDPFEANIVVEPDSDELWKFIRNYEDRETEKNLVSFTEAAKAYDFDEASRNYEKISEIVRERINTEYKAWMKRSKCVRATLYMGVGLTASAGAIAGFQKLHWLLREVPYIYPALPYMVKQLIESTRLAVNKTTSWLVDHWPFAEKGFPYILFNYGKNPEKHRKGPADKEDVN